MDYIFKPRLTCFDLDNAGAIVGQISTGAVFAGASKFVIKAETLSDDGTYHVIKRYTVPDAKGKFVLYPLPAAAATSYDLVLRGLNYRTVIIKNVPVSKDTTPWSGATAVGTVLMTASSHADVTANGSIVSPTGAWIDFYQTLPGAGEVPYDIRVTHFNPLTGKFSGFPLSDDLIQVGTYISSGLTSTLTTTAPQEGTGNYQAIASAVLYNRSAFPGPGHPNVLFSTPTITFGTLAVSAPYVGNTVSGSIISQAANQNEMSTGVTFAIKGGMIVDAVSTDSQMASGGTYTVPNIPGGTSANPVQGACYAIEALGWNSSGSVKAIAFPPGFANVCTSNAQGVDLHMLVF